MINVRSARVMVMAGAWCLVAHAAPAHAAPAKTASAQERLTGAIDGIVTDTNLVALGGATISVLGSALSVVTGANGRFRIVNIPAGRQYIVIAKRLGYAPVSTMVHVADADTMRLSFALERIAGILDTVVIAGKSQSPRMAEFDERRMHSVGGHFVTQAEIEKQNPTFLTDMLRMLPGITVKPAPMGNDIVYSYRYHCPVAILVDGAFPLDGSLNQLSAKEISGIEVYSGPATIPLRYKRSGSGKCGLIIVWTRDGSQP